MVLHCVCNHACMCIQNAVCKLKKHVTKSTSKRARVHGRDACGLRIRLGLIEAHVCIPFHAWPTSLVHVRNTYFCYVTRLCLFGIRHTVKLPDVMSRKMHSVVKQRSSGSGSGSSGSAALPPMSHATTQFACSTTGGMHILHINESRQQIALRSGLALKYTRNKFVLQ